MFHELSWLCDRLRAHIMLVPINKQLDGQTSVIEAHWSLLRLKSSPVRVSPPSRRQQQIWWLLAMSLVLYKHSPDLQIVEKISGESLWLDQSKTPRLASRGEAHPETCAYAFFGHGLTRDTRHEHITTASPRAQGH